LPKLFLKILKDLGCENPRPISALYHLLLVKIPPDRSQQIGTDIVCNAVEAYTRFQGPCVIVDFGTVLTFTAIAPGLAIVA
jgi:pantothenate kinase type III